MTMRTAGRVVAFSAMTVAAALAALIVFRQRFLYSMGVGGALCALIAAGVSLTLLPALLGALGERVNAGGPRRWKEAIAREAAGERVGLLVPPLAPGDAPAGAGRDRRGGAADRAGAAVPADRVHRAWTRRCCRSEQTARMVDDAIRPEFPPSETSPVYIAVEPGASEAEVRAFAARLPAPVAPPRVSEGRIDLIAPGPPLGERRRTSSRAVRAVAAPFEFQVGGQTARLRRPAGVAARAPAVGARDPVRDDAHHPVLHDRARSCCR